MSQISNLEIKRRLLSQNFIWKEMDCWFEDNGHLPIVISLSKRLNIGETDQEFLKLRNQINELFDSGLMDEVRSWDCCFVFERVVIEEYDWKDKL